MTIAIDASSRLTTTSTTTSGSWTHTPVGTPKGVVVLITQIGVTDEITGVTYGGVAMTRQNHQSQAGGGDPTAAYVYFLGSGIPTGAQTVAVTSSAAQAYTATAVTVTATAATTVVDIQNSGTGTANNTTMLLDYTDGLANWVAVVCYADGTNTVAGASISNGTSMFTNDMGNACGYFSQTSGSAGNSFTFTTVGTNGSWAWGGVVLAEGAGGGGGGTIAFDSSGSTINNASATSITIDITSAAVGATCYAFLGTGIQTSDPSMSGWTAVGVRNDEGATTSCMLFRRVKQLGDTTFSLAYPSAFKATAVWSSYTGLDAVTPDDGAGTYVAQTGSANYAATLTNTFTGGWAVLFGFPRSTTAGRTCTPDAAMTERQDVVNNASVFFTTTVDDSNGTVTAASHTYTMVSSGSDSHGGTMLIYLKPGSGATNTNQEILVSIQAAISRASRW